VSRGGQKSRLCESEENLHFSCDRTQPSQQNFLRNSLAFMKNFSKNQAGEDGFQKRKSSCLSKRDRSSAGRIDPKAVQICAAINARDEYYTTSSCGGRSFLYCGDGIKAHHHFANSKTDEDKDTDVDDKDDETIRPSGHGFFNRFRVNHDIIRDAERYFNFSSLDPGQHDDFDPSGGGDPVRSIGQYDYKQEENNSEQENEQLTTSIKSIEEKFNSIVDPVWMRYEPFILHVMCRSLDASQALMNAARPAFKNVGLTTWKHGFGRYIVAIWGDEGIDMPLTTPGGNHNFVLRGQEEWLKTEVNERHARNWQKINRFVDSVRSMPEVVDQTTSKDEWVQDYVPTDEAATIGTNTATVAPPKRFDVIGDVALIHSVHGTHTTEELEDIGKAIMKRNKAIKVVAVRSSVLSGSERSPGEEGLAIIAGMQRSPLVTSHIEYGIKCVVDLNNTFFSSRMGPERLRICQQVARGENVLALFCGVAMDAMQIVSRTEATVLAVELNPIAVECANRGKRMLQRNKAVRCAGAADRLDIVEGDALEVMSTLEHTSFDRILAPRPKEGNMDGDLGKGDGGVNFLRAMLPLLKDQGECHWYDFAADWELPNCERTRKGIESVCDELGFQMDVIHLAKVGSIAKKQHRVCLDFRVLKK